MAFAQSGLESGEIGNAGGVFDERLAIDEGGVDRQRAELIGGGGELFRPIQTAPRAQGDAPALDLGLQAIPVKIYLMQPAGAAPRPPPPRGGVRVHESPPV